MPTYQHQLSLRTLVAGVVVVFLVILAEVYAHYFYTAPAHPPIDVATISVNNKAGNYEAALHEYNAIANSTTTSPTNKAMAVLNAHGAMFNITGNIQDFIDEVQAKQKIAVDPNVDLDVRVNALGEVAGSFCSSGRNPLVFKVIYSVPPFSNYLVKGDPDLSSRKMYEWSFSMMPTSKAALRIARWYVEDPLWHTNLPQATVQDDIAKAEYYLQQGNALASQELQSGKLTVSAGSGDHRTYLYWHAYVIGALAKLKGEPYKSEYKQNYENYFAYVKNQNSVYANITLPFAHMFYANYLLINDNDTAGAQAQLQQAIDYVKADTHPELLSFATFIQNERQLKPWDNPSQVLYNMENFYQPFKDLVNNTNTRGYTNAVSINNVDYATLVDSPQ
jgi:hypothetical protein